MDHADRVAKELRLNTSAVARTSELLAQGATAPFVARYRKEVTGGLTETQIIQIRDLFHRAKKLEERRQTLLRGVGETPLPPDFPAKVEAAPDWDRLDDLFARYRLKHSAEATRALEQGLEPLVDFLWSRSGAEGDPAMAYINAEKGLAEPAQVWAGARELLAERISVDADLRLALRDEFEKKAMVRVAVVPGKENKAADKYQEYFDVHIAAERVSGPRVMAIRRGAKEGLLSYHIGIERDAALQIIRSHLALTADLPWAEHWLAAADAAWDKYLAPALENSAKRDLQRRAEKEGIESAAKAFRRMLLAPPLGGKWMLVVDPGDDCRLVALDGAGALLASTMIQPLRSDYDRDQAQKVVEDYCRRYRIEIIVISAGTSAREIENFFRQIDREQLNDADLLPFAGSPTLGAIVDRLRQELPDVDDPIRRAIAICRCLQDPLAELVRCDPLAIIGAHHHLDQSLLKQALYDTVCSCVAAVGVDVNTAHEELLAHVVGLDRQTAEAIVRHRAKHGAFTSREQISQVPQLDAVAFEQAAGFLRVKHGENPLDATAIHPMHYPIIAQMAADLGVEVRDLLESEETRRRIDPTKYRGDGLCEATLKDLLAELAAPGRDPRQALKPMRLNPELGSLDQLKEGMIIDGVVANLSQFGAFVNVGVQDGLVHVSELSHHFVDDPAKVLQVGQNVKVKVIAVDLARKRLSLSIKQTQEPPPAPPAPPRRRPESRPEMRLERRPEARGEHREDRPPRPMGKQRPREPQGKRPLAQAGKPHHDSPFSALYMENGVLKMREDTNKKKNK